jgi:serine/threonine-protein kinase HipA
MRQCEIYLHGIRCGILTESDSREFSFIYDRAYLLGEYAQPVSLTLHCRVSHTHPLIYSLPLRTCFPKVKTAWFSHSF